MTPVMTVGVTLTLTVLALFDKPIRRGAGRVADAEARPSRATAEQHLNGRLWARHGGSSSQLDANQEFTQGAAQDRFKVIAALAS